MKIMLVDDNQTFLDGLIFLLTNHEEIEIVAVANDGKEALELIKEKVPELVLMDIEMPYLNGIEATKRILWKYPKIKFIAVTMYQDKAYLSELIGAGFKGCIFKNHVVDELEKAIDAVMNGKYFFPEDILLENDRDLTF
ncbi:MAG: response regulator transcription factor [Bacteroidales bacterium]|nr:response regulator transcription factor [Bacteroidales bacterium]